MNSLKEIVLKQSNSGLDFFKHIINDLEMKDEVSCELASNPFYNDTKPSLSIYFNERSQRWMFKDFGDESYSGDVFDFAAHYYGLDSKKDFYSILKSMAKDLKIESEVPSEVAKIINIFGYKAEYKNGEGLKEAYEYFKQFGITESVLRQYRVRAVEKCYYLTRSGESKSRIFKEQELFIAYNDNYFAKIYSPNPKGFFYIGNKPKDFVFGVNQIFIRAHKAKFFPDTLILTGGEKDVLTLTSLGYDAISLNSETATIPQTLTENLFDAYKNIVIFYDNDETGIRRSAQIWNELKDRFNVSIYTLPDTIDGVGVKDVSDYMKHELPIDILKRSIEIAIKEYTTPQSIENEKAESDIVMDKSPVFPDWLYSKLPKFLKDLSLQFHEPEERDLSLISSLAVLSSFFPTVRGYYGHGKVAANLYFFVAAPSSAGKGVMMYAKRLGSGIQKLLFEEYTKAYKKYLADYEHYKSNVKDNPDMDEPEKPQQKVMFIPANTSVSKMIQILGANKNFGIILESEGDTLSTSLKNEWANYSDVLRKAAHHETVSMARRMNDEFIEIENPCLSVALSGTPNQVEALIGGVENGLTSRFLFYELTKVKPWKDQFAIPDMTREEVYKEASEYICRLWKKQSSGKETIVRLPEFAAEMHTEFFTEKFERLRATHGDDIIASVRRHGLICFRIMMLLAIFRHLEQNEWLPENLDVTEKDVNLALVITEVLMIHLVSVFRRLEGGAVYAKLNPKQRSLLEALPDAFTKTQYSEIREAQGLKKAVAEKYIADLIKHGAIIRIDQGKYQKVA